jgi:hypothetical protein
MTFAALTTRTVTSEPRPARIVAPRGQWTVVAEPTPVELRWPSRRWSGSPWFARWATYVGECIDAHGLSSVTREIDALVALARPLGVAPIAAEVLADQAQTEATRIRAFARLVQALIERH